MNHDVLASKVSLIHLMFVKTAFADRSNELACFDCECFEVVEVDAHTATVLNFYDPVGKLSLSRIAKCKLHNPTMTRRHSNFVLAVPKILSFA